LANVVGIRVQPATGVGATGWTIVDPLPVPDVRVRRSHVATATIQELLCGPLFGAVVGAPPSNGTPVVDVQDAGGPRVDPASVKITTNRDIRLDFTAPLSLRSVGPDQFSVTAFSIKGGWTTFDIKDVTLDSTANTVLIALKDTIATGLTVRLIARGSGPQPLLGTDHVPLAGAVGGPPGSVNDGHDFVIMLRRK
jgi:hypothetical protein